MVGVVDVAVVADRPVGEWHRHTWHAATGDDRWRCTRCPAEVAALTRADKTPIPLPKVTAT
jgi:hypothetical protein